MHDVLLNAVKEKAWGLDPQMYHVDDLSEVVLQSLAVALQAAGDRTALRVLVDVCDKTRPGTTTTLALLCRDWNWVMDQGEERAADLLFQAWRKAYEVCGAATIDVLIRACERAADATEGVPHVDALFDTCEWTLGTAQESATAVAAVSEVMERATGQGPHQEASGIQSEELPGSGYLERGKLDTMLRTQREAVEQGDDPVPLLQLLAAACVRMEGSRAETCDPSQAIKSLLEAFIDVIEAAGNPQRAISGLWVHYDQTVSEEYHELFMGLLEAYWVTIQAVRDPADLLDPLFEALHDAISRDQTIWLPERGLVVEACLEAITTTEGPAAAVDVLLMALEQAIEWTYDDIATADLLARSYSEVVVSGSKGPHGSAEMVFKVLKSVIEASADLEGIADILVSGLNDAVRLLDDLEPARNILCQALLVAVDMADDTDEALDLLLEHAARAIERAENRPAAVTSLLQALCQHVPNEPVPLVLIPALSDANAPEPPPGREDPLTATSPTTARSADATG